MGKPTKSFRDLIAWQKAKQLALLVYRATARMPSSEMFGLTNQMRRASISISSNIAEGYNRFHKKEKRQFLVIAFASASELQSQLEIASELYPDIDFAEAQVLAPEVSRILNSVLSTVF